MRDKLIKQFKKVGLILKVLDKPIGATSNNDIFQMDIGREVTGTRRVEWFEIYLGHKDNKVQILDVDHKLNQILLLVREPEREFEIKEIKRYGKYAVIPADRRLQLHKQNIEFRETKTHFILTDKTPPDNRHFLMGVDERQLFVAQLKQGVTNINKAKQQLGSSVKFHEGVRKMTPRRQGEWFFLKTTREQEDDIELLLEKNKIWIEKKVNIGTFTGRAGGNPHVADELVVVPNIPGLIESLKVSKCVRKKISIPKFPIRDNDVYVRGKIRHIDHKTIKYRHWYQVVLNNEGDTSKATQSWID